MFLSPAARRFSLPVLFALAPCAAALLPAPAAADTLSGPGWSVVFNRPDQTTSATSLGEGEFDIRDAFVARLDALESGDSAMLATYTFSGGEGDNGGAGVVLRAVSNALARGASVGFVVGSGVDTANEFASGCSLASLAARATNPLVLSQAPSGGVMHHKVGVFTYAASGEKRLLAASWNFTAGASSQQWNVLFETTNATLHAAYSRELSQLLGGTFHHAADKAHFDAAFRTYDSHADGAVRFSPYAESGADGDNALRDITNRIAKARSSIWFALNKQTRAVVTDQLVAAADRGVEVHGVIPKSDRAATNDASYAQWERLSDRASYATTNRVHLHEAWTSSAQTERDDGASDLVHCKYMVLDPGTAHPWVIHGSANWTAAALSSTPSQYVNDENVLFIPDSAVAFAFLQQFAAMTGVSVPVDEPDALALSFDENVLFCAVPKETEDARVLVGTRDPASWTADWTHPLSTGTTALALPDGVERMFFRIEGK